MLFEWDEDKRQTNLIKHGIDFVDAKLIWLSPVLDPVSQRVVAGETRSVAIGTIGDDQFVVAVVYTQRGSAKRLISARRARRYERSNYQDVFGSTW